MKRAIYVGPPKSFWTGAFGLDFGVTGEVQPVVCAVKGKRWCFWADGCGGLGMHFLLKREDVYIPSEDQTRHCPNRNGYTLSIDVVRHSVPFVGKYNSFSV